GAPWPLSPRIRYALYSSDHGLIVLRFSEPVPIALSNGHHSIEVRRLTKYYGSAPAIKDVSFTVRPGEVVGFLGPNGAGKSTTLRILSGLLRADRGEAYIDGISVAREPARVKERIGFMPENNPLPDD